MRGAADARTAADGAHAQHDGGSARRALHADEQASHVIGAGGRGEAGDGAEYVDLLDTDYTEGAAEEYLLEEEYVADGGGLPPGPETDLGAAGAAGAAGSAGVADVTAEATGDDDPYAGDAADGNGGDLPYDAVDADDEGEAADGGAAGDYAEGVPEEASAGEEAGGNGLVGGTGAAKAEVATGGEVKGSAGARSHVGGGATVAPTIEAAASKVGDAPQQDGVTAGAAAAVDEGGAAAAVDEGGAAAAVDEGGAAPATGAATQQAGAGSEAAAVASAEGGGPQAVKAAKAATSSGEAGRQHAGGAAATATVAAGGGGEGAASKEGGAAEATGEGPGLDLETAGEGDQDPLGGGLPFAPRSTGEAPGAGQAKQQAEQQQQQPGALGGEDAVALGVTGTGALAVGGKGDRAVAAAQAAASSHGLKLDEAVTSKQAAEAEAEAASSTGGPGPHTAKWLKAAEGEEAAGAQQQGADATAAAAAAAAAETQAERQAASGGAAAAAAAQGVGVVSTTPAGSAPLDDSGGGGTQQRRPSTGAAAQAAAAQAAKPDPTLVLSEDDPDSGDWYTASDSDGNGDTAPGGKVAATSKVAAAAAAKSKAEAGEGEGAGDDWYDGDAGEVKGKKAPGGATASPAAAAAAAAARGSGGSKTAKAPGLASPAQAQEGGSQPEGDAEKVYSKSPPPPSPPGLSEEQVSAFFTQRVAQSVPSVGAGIVWQGGMFRYPGVPAAAVDATDSMFSADNVSYAWSDGDDNANASAAVGGTRLASMGVVDQAAATSTWCAQDATGESPAWTHAKARWLACPAGSVITNIRGAFFGDAGRKGCPLPANSANATAAPDKADAALMRAGAKEGELCGWPEVLQHAEGRCLGAPACMPLAGTSPLPPNARECANAAAYARFEFTCTKQRELMGAEFFDYLGCFADSLEARTMSHLLMSSEYGLSIQACATAAHDSALPLFALQNGTKGQECWGGRSFSRARKGGATVEAVKRAYLSSWEDEAWAHGWIGPCESDVSKAHCNTCNKDLQAKMTSHKGFSCPTFERLAEMAIVMVPVSVEEERLFSALNFIKSKARNRLMNPHLSYSLRLFFSNTFDLLSFPYAEALKAWKEAVAARGRYKKGFTSPGGNSLFELRRSNGGSPKDAEADDQRENVAGRPGCSTPLPRIYGRIADLFGCWRPLAGATQRARAVLDASATLKHNNMTTEMCSRHAASLSAPHFATTSGDTCVVLTDFFALTNDMLMAPGGCDTPCNGSHSMLDRCGSRAGHLCVCGGGGGCGSRSGHLSVFAVANRTQVQLAAYVASLAGALPPPLETVTARTGAGPGIIMWQ
ncbi:hypothetical protein FOA52_004426, partial [Chlamydomonas sp. UWO 241]